MAIIRTEYREAIKWESGAELYDADTGRYITTTHGKKEGRKTMKTGKTAKIRNGNQLLTRAIYADSIGDYFKYKGEKCYIYKRANGTYNAPYFNGVKII